MEKAPRPRMKRDSLIYAISGTFFGLLAGWILGSQQVSAPTAPAPAPAAASAPANTTPGAGTEAASSDAPTPVDATKVADFERTANAEPTNEGVRANLANLYFDSKHYDQAITWYEAALKIDPKDVDVSTDLAVAYYYMGQDDRALAQIQHSLDINPNHAKALFNQGIIRAFGKHDLPAAAESWQKVINVAPDSEEARLSKQALDGMRNGHKDDGTTAAGGGSE
jgi:cytochrome c-type biogenesis protein CcmH/NrfG